MAINDPSLLALYGRFHPLVLHFPIALLIMSASFEVYRTFKNANAFSTSSWILLLVGCVSSVIAASMGFLLSISGTGYQGETVEAHRFWGISVAVLAITSLATRYLWQNRNYPFTLPLHRSALLGSVISIFIAGHYGGALTHGENFIPSAAPKPVAFLFGEHTNPKKTIVSADYFNGKIKPVLEKSCFSCHGPSKQQGDLRLDFAQNAFSGGESGLPAIVPSQPMKSEIIRRLFLPQDQKKAMPPEGRERPNAEDLVLLMDWIAMGAPWTGEYTGPTLIPEMVLAEGILPSSENVTFKAKKLGISPIPLSNDSVFFSVDLSKNTESAQNLSKALSLIGEYVAWLKLPADTRAKEIIKATSQMHNLTRINAANAPLQDQDIKHLSKAEQLRHLNLVGTQVTAKGVRRLNNLEQLKKLYLWGSNVSPKDIPALERAFEHSEIYHAAQITTAENGSLDPTFLEAQE